MIGGEFAVPGQPSRRSGHDIVRSYKSEAIAPESRTQCARTCTARQTREARIGAEEANLTETEGLAMHVLAIIVDYEWAGQK